MAYASPLAFTDHIPDGFPQISGEPEFNPARHLALETPEQRFNLSDLGYSEAEAAACPSDLGITSPFRMLTEEGAACLLEVCRLLEPYTRSNARIERNVRGAVYQSKFLRDLCLSPDVNAFTSEICGVPTLPHPMPHQLGHINFPPTRVGENVDKWHTDTLRYDYVLFVTDPKSVDGGEFQYFKGTRRELEDLRIRGEAVPADRIISPELPAAGYAVLQQGNMVVHRAKGLNAPGERITMVSAYVPAEVGFPDYTRLDQLWLVDPQPVCAAEYMRQTAWIAEQMLQREITEPVYSDDREAHAARLEAVAEVLANASRELRAAGEAEMDHLGDN